MRFIHVGVGGFGQVWVRTLKENKDAEVVALVDVSEPALEAARAVSGCGADRCFRTLEDALGAVEADALVSSTPPAFHKHDAVTAMKAGLHVISEKPMSDNLASCRDMLRTSLKTGRTYAVSQNYRYGPQTWTMAQIIRSGRLGAVGQVKLDFFKGVNFGGGFRHEMPYPLIIDMSIHHFDLIRFITGLDAVSVTATAWNPPWSNYKGDCSSSAVFEMNNGARVLYNGSWCAKGDYCDWNGNWQIECEKGTLVYRHGEITIKEAPELYQVTSEAKAPQEAPPLGGQAFVLNEFMTSLREKRRPQTDVTDNIWSVGMVFATVQAMETGKKAAVLDKPTRALLAGLRG